MLTHHFPPVRIAPRYTASLLVLCTLALLFFSSTANRVAAFFLFWHGVRIVHDVLQTGRLRPYAWPRALLDMRGILQHIAAQMAGILCRLRRFSGGRAGSLDNPSVFLAAICFCIGF